MRGSTFRRTSTVDVVRPDGLSEKLVVDGVGRDLLVSPGQSSKVELGSVHLEASPERIVTDFRCSSDRVDEVSLIGRRLGSGFRSTAVRAVDSHRLTRLLLDDVAIVSLLSGYVEVYLGRPAGDGFVRPDLCAGWAQGGVLLSAVRLTGDVPLPTGPPAPKLADGDAWHDLPDLPPFGLRRARRIDVSRQPTGLTIDAMFRDSWVDAHGAERVIHEYGVAASVHPETHTFIALEAVPRVLPWMECPLAAASAQSLVSTPVNELMATVDRTFRGPSTCTHLSALFRALAGPVYLAVDGLPLIM